MRLRHWPVTVAAVVVLTSGLSGCRAETAETPAPAATQSAAAEPPAGPADDACYLIDYDSAVSPTSDAAPTACTARHTSETFRVGEVDAVVDGHLLAVDSEHVRDAVASRCRAALGRFVRGSERQLRLSMIRPVWFTPTLEQSDAGAAWYRCDAVVLAGTETLVDLTSSLRRALADGVPERFAMCGSSAPDAKAFERVRCSERHRWRAVDVITFDTTTYPGAKAAQSAGRARCEDAAAQRAEDPLTFEWGYEWPTREQWEMGQTFGRCWAKE